MVESLTSGQALGILAAQGSVVPPGRYWYDSLGGLWGLEGREAGGFIRAGLDFGPLAADASGGDKGIFINGREINVVEAAYYQQILGALYRGRWWFDGPTGCIGTEGNPVPAGNVFAALRQAEESSQGDHSWCSRRGPCGNSNSEGSEYIAVLGGGKVGFGHD